MQGTQGNATNQSSEKPANGSLQVPSISLPKGGGAIRDIAEKFSVNPSNGSASMSVPLFTTPSRSNFYPQLSISYESGSGNGPFGLGWKISIPSITRKTDKGLPEYQDAQDSDIFILSDAEDLVPAFIKNGTTYRRDSRTETLPDGKTYAVQRYRPRVEGLFARIERWQDSATGDIFWKSISKDNVASIYGQTADARMANPEDPTQVFQWLLERSYDDKGNSIVYEYKREDAVNIPPSPAESNRLLSTTAFANRYVKRIRYGKASPNENPEYLFLVIFDYGEHDANNPTPNEVISWPCRLDPFSNCRAAFEIRTYRLCRRVLMFHNFSELSPTLYLARSTDLFYDENPVCSYLTSAIQRGYLWDDTSSNNPKPSFPPLEFGYSRPTIDPTIKFIDPESVENLPVGLDQMRYRWIDLDSEGISGILAEQPEAWYYKRNCGQATFAPTQLITNEPRVAERSNTRLELLDLAGDGRKALVQFAEPLAGFSERDERGNWGPFKPFQLNPSISWNDANVRMIDLDGDGFSDVLISEDELFTWYRSLAKRGFSSFQTVRKTTDEERGPALVFADPTESIYLADMTGDGLADIVRIRNGEICYWMNLGFGRFSHKVMMDHSPIFDHSDTFNQKQIRLADIDGSGTSDIIYLRHDSISFWFNQSGNSWSESDQIENFPPADDFSSVSTVDLFGNGTSCIVWSSPLPEDVAHPMGYIDLMSGRKPHLLMSVTNNMGKKTLLEYAASTQFYLADRAAGNPWVTRLPFPVQVVQKATTFDGVSQTQLTSIYSYHHGFYDGIEREFRGFGRVDQWDTESFAAYAGIGELPGGPGALDKELYVPPVHTKTWFHTGTFFGRGRISRHLAHEYYKGDAAAADLQDTAIPPELTGEEERETCRALKGRILRQEVYAEDNSLQTSDPYSVIEKNYSLRLVQPFAGNPHAVLFAAERETLSYHYERKPADPRISQDLTLEVDDFGNVTRSASIAYPRRTTASNSPAPEQLETLCTYSEFDFINLANDPSIYRIGVPSETRSYEITGLGNPAANGLYDFDTLRTTLPNAAEIAYEETPSPGLEKRLFQRTRTLYFKNDLSGPLPLGQLESLALPYETYQLAFTAGLLANVYATLVDDTKLSRDGKYLKGADYIANGLFPSSDHPGLWWIPSGRRVFNPGIFYQPVQFTDPWGNSTVVGYDRYALLTTQATDALKNTTSAVPDYRVMLPYLLTDSNGNQSQVAFDALGMVVGTATMGKPTDSPPQGDSLTGFQGQLDDAVILAHIQDPLTKPGDILRLATSRLVYDLWAFYRTKTIDSHGNEFGKPVVAYTLARETHVSDLGSGQTKFQHQFLYSDGFGRAVQTKIVAEPGLTPARGPDGQLLYDAVGNLVIQDTSPNPRWIGTGRTVYDNKGNPVKKYEPFFSSTSAYEDEKDLVQTGVTQILHYDPLGRLIRTDNPNGTFSQMEFDPWQQISSDENDTVLQSQWYADRGSPNPTGPEPSGPPDTRAAWLAAQHANTRTITQLDVLDRTFLSVADNGVDSTGSPQKYPTRTKLDIQGNPLVVTDARGNQAMITDFDMMKRPLHTKSIDAGQRWTLQDVAGKPIWAWDSNQNQVQIVYDELHRQTFTYLLLPAGTRPIVIQRVVYADRPDSNMPSPPEQANLRGKVYQSYNGAGAVTNQQYDFKGNLLQSSRQLTQDPAYRKQMDWTPLGATNDVQRIAANASLLLATSESFAHSTTYDALNRPVTVKTPDQSLTSASYNERRLPKQVSVYSAPKQQNESIVTSISYNEKGQRLECDYGNGAVTKYSYDPETYRLTDLKTTRPNGGGTDLLQDLNYYYDPVGNVVEMDDGAQETIYFDNLQVDATSKYRYDPIYRLIEATGREHVSQSAAQPPPQYDYRDPFRIGLPLPSDGQAMAKYLEQYQYDQVGNFSQVTHQVSVPYTANSWTRYYQNDTASNQLLSTSLPTDAATPPYSAKYQYDANGNVLGMPQLQIMQWDFKNQLQMTQRQAVNTDDTDGIRHQGERTYYVYDAAGQRARKVTESSGGVKLNERIYLGGYELYREYTTGNAKPTLERQTLHVMDDKHRVAMIESKTIDSSVASTSLPVTVTRYQFDNHLGSACLELDDQAAIISYEEYYPYGSTSYQAVNTAIEVSAKRYGYTGKERDDETGFYYHGARYYAPWLGRWTNCDPAGLIDNLDLYIYARSNPVRFADRSGRQSGEPPQMHLTEQSETRVPSTPTVSGRGYGKNVRSTIQAFGSQWMLGKVDVGDPEGQPFATTPPGTTRLLRAQPSKENQELGRTVVKAQVKAAEAAGLPVRKNDYWPGGVKGTKFGQPDLPPKLQGLTDPLGNPREVMHQTSFKFEWAQGPASKQSGSPVQTSFDFGGPSKTSATASAAPPAAAEPASPGTAAVEPEPALRAPGAKPMSGAASVEGAFGLGMLGLGIALAAPRAIEAQNRGDTAGAVLAWSTAVPGEMGAAFATLELGYHAAVALNDLEIAWRDSGMIEAGFTSPMQAIATNDLPAGATKPPTTSASEAQANVLGWLTGMNFSWY
ncbi:MAG TPA: SpvB/TcaC N-terminal domain-containing protein [Candidatus Acidoferrum sp.]|nr:SpvB/TcaC N-terminal domain-containing protein [Candidatus Acidoferrum sp.]